MTSAGNSVNIKYVCLDKLDKVNMFYQAEGGGGEGGRRGWRIGESTCFAELVSHVG